MIVIPRERKYEIEMPLRIEVLVRQHISNIKINPSLDRRALCCVLEKGRLFGYFDTKLN